MEPKRLNQNSQMDLQEMMKKVVSLENTLVLQAKEIELQSNEIKSLKQMLSANIAVHRQPVYGLPGSLGKGQENLQHHHHHHVMNQQPYSGAHLSTGRQPKRYSREFLDNVRYSTGAANYSSYTMNPLVHPPTAIPPINLPQPMGGIINVRSPSQTMISATNINNNNNNNTSKSDANQSNFKLKPTRLHATSTSLQPSLPVTSNGRFEPSISVNGFRHDENGDSDSSTRKQDANVYQRQGLVENPHNNATNIAASKSPALPIPVLYWKTKEVTFKMNLPRTSTTKTRVVDGGEPNKQQDHRHGDQTASGTEVDSETSRASETGPDLMGCSEDENSCRCPTLYYRRERKTKSNPDDGEISMDELTSEEQEEPSYQEPYLSNPRAEKVRLIIPRRDEATLNYRFRFKNKADELEGDETKGTTNDLPKSNLNISGWPSLRYAPGAKVSSRSPKKKAPKLDLSSKFTVQSFINYKTLS